MRWLSLVVLAGCYPPHDPPAAPNLADDLAMSFRMEESGDGPRIDDISGIEIYPWKKLGAGTYHQDGIGTTQVPGVVGNGQHIDGAAGYHFAAASRPVMEHGGNSFTWVGWASIDTNDAYTDSQTMLAKWTGVPDTAVPGDRREYRLWFEPALARWQFEVSADGLEGEGHSLVLTHPLPIERDQLYFVEAWHDADAQTVNLRVSDRVALGAVESAAWDRGVFSSPADLDVGAQNACADHHLQGTLDALGYWSRALTEIERAALWNGGAGLEP